MNNWIKENYNKFSGSILVSKGNDILVNEGFGFADREKNISNTKNTRFLIGSISKVFTAMAIMKLSEDGYLDIDESVNKYIKVEGLEDKVKIHNLLNHTSGVKNYVMCRKSIDLKKENDPLIIVEVMCKLKRNFVCGEKFSYNNTGYMLLALVIESVTNEKFEAYIEKNIFQHLGMKDSGFISKFNKEICVGYKNGKKSEIFHPSAFYGCGDIVSTVEDLRRFMVALNEGRIIDNNLVRKMQTISAKNKAMSYGLGMMITEKVGEYGIGHGGSIPDAYSTFISYYPDSDLTIIILCNDITSIKSFVPSVCIAQYMERCIYEKVTLKKLGYLKKIMF